MYMRMQGMSKDFQTVYQAWAGTRKIGVAVAEIHPFTPNAGQIVPARLLLQQGQVLQGARGRESAAGDEQHIGPAIHNELPGCSARRLPCCTQNIYAARHLNQSRVPVTGAEAGINPFQKGHARPGRNGNTRGSFHHLPDARLQF